MVKNEYFRIADHSVFIETERDYITTILPEFAVFAASPTKNPLYLRVGGDEPTRPSGILYYTFKTDNYLCHCYHNRFGYQVTMSQKDKVVVSIQTKQLYHQTEIRGTYEPSLLRFALWLAFGFESVDKMTVALHASTIVYNGRATLFIAESGTGKSTHTSLIQKVVPESYLLNDDSPIVRYEGNGCMVYGSPWSGKTPCYRQEKAVLNGIVKICRAQQNRIEELTVIEALQQLLPAFPPELYMNETLKELYAPLLSKIIESVPVYRLYCLPNRDAAKLSFGTLYPKVRRWKL